MNLQAIVDEITATLRPQAGQQGQVASYIPALARVRSDRFGIALRTFDGLEAAAGDSDVPFSIQSVSKLFSLTLGLQLIGESMWDRIGREPSGTPFNALVQLEREEGKPRNPVSNAGSIAVADRLISQGRTEIDGGHASDWLVHRSTSTKR
jgi:glutaminase